MKVKSESEVTQSCPTLHDPDNHDGVITHLEPGILECEVKWALGSITMNKASGGDGEGNGNPLQYSCLENPINRGAWWAAVHGVAKSDTTVRIHFHFSLSCTGEGNGNPLQCSCLENPRDGGAWWAAVYRVAQSRTQLKQLSSSSSMPI